MSKPEDIASRLRTKAITVYEQHTVDEATLAAKLEVFPSAIRRMLWQETWPVERSIRFLDALGIDVEISLIER